VSTPAFYDHSQSPAVGYVKPYTLRLEPCTGFLLKHLIPLQRILYQKTIWIFGSMPEDLTLGAIEFKCIK
jgi:hypothetical protein